MAHEFKPTVGAQVKKADALKWIEKFEKERKKDTRSVFYGKDAIMTIFKDTTVTGISFFFCRKTNKAGKEFDDLVLVGTREDGSLVWSDKEPSLTAMTASAASDEGSGVYEEGTQCPPYCTR
jgi:hypothetical protein